MSCHLIAFPAIRPDLERFAYESKHMGTTFRIVLYAADQTTAKKAADAAFARVAELDNCMSDYKQTSELMQLCKKFATETGEPVKVSDDSSLYSRRPKNFQRSPMARLMSPWARWCNSGGTRGELKSYRTRKNSRRPAQKVGYQKIKLDPGMKTVQLASPGMQLDLGGIAKGYAADEALKLLRVKYSLTRALIAASGDITCGDPPPGKSFWTVDIVPIAKSQKPRTLHLANASVSTSGDLEQFVVIGGVRYSHVLDPRTGLGLTGRRSVTVIAPNGITADSMTKAVSVLSPERA